MRRAAELLDRLAEDQLLLRIGVPVDRRPAVAPIGRRFQRLARRAAEPRADDLVLAVDRLLVDGVALQARLVRIDVVAHPAVNVTGGRLEFPQRLARGRVDQEHAAGLAASLDVREHFQPGVIGVDVADEQAVGMALAGAPQRHAVVVEHHRAQGHLVAAVAVDVHALGEVGALAPVLGRGVGVAVFPQRAKLVADQFVGIDLHQAVGAAHDDQARRAAVEIGHGQLVARDEVVAVESAAARPGARAISLPVSPSQTATHSGPSTTRPRSLRGSPSITLAITSARPSPLRSHTSMGENQLRFSIPQPRSRRQRCLPSAVKASIL